MRIEPLEDRVCSLWDYYMRRCFRSWWQGFREVRGLGTRKNSESLTPFLQYVVYVEQCVQFTIFWQSSAYPCLRCISRHVQLFHQGHQVPKAQLSYNSEAI